MITPLEIQNQEFRKALRGYNEEEVDQFLDRVVRDYETLFKENHELKETISELEEKMKSYRDLEDTLQKTLILAQKTAEDIKANAEKEAELLIREARIKAENMLKEAEETVARQTADYQELKQRAEQMRVQLKSFLKAQLEVIGDQEIAAAEGAILEGRATANGGDLGS